MSLLSYLLVMIDRQKKAAHKTAVNFPIFLCIRWEVCADSHAAGEN